MADDEVALMQQLHAEHSAALWHYCLRLTSQDRARAEDVVQETLLRAWRHRLVLDNPPPAVRAWLFTVARNLVIDDRRSARFAREISTDDLPERASADATEAVLDRWLITDALTTLSPEHRTVLVSAYYLARPIAEIARREQVPEGTVKSRLHYALRAMRLALQERGVTE